MALVKEGSVDCVYNPLMYAWDVHKRYIEISGDRGAKTVMLGMNPGPHGMGQMGIPFAATSMQESCLVTDRSTFCFLSNSAPDAKAFSS